MVNLAIGNCRQFSAFSASDTLLLADNSTHPIKLDTSSRSWGLEWECGVQNSLARVAGLRQVVEGALRDNCISDGLVGRTTQEAAVMTLD